MKVTYAVLVLGLVCIQVTRAQDPAKTDPDKYRVIFENERVRVLEYRDKPGEKTTMHKHPAFALYAFSPFKRTLTLGDGKVISREFKAGDVMWSEAQVHIGANVGDTETHVLIMELKEESVKPAESALGKERLEADAPQTPQLSPPLSDRAAESGTGIQIQKENNTMRIYVSSVLVDDQDKAFKFYTEKLGFVKKTDVPVGKFRWLTLVSPDNPDGTELLLEPNDNPVARTFQEGIFRQGIPLTSFAVNDIKEEYERLKKLGVVFTMEPTKAGPVTIALFNDTCGNLIQIVERQ